MNRPLTPKSPLPPVEVSVIHGRLKLVAVALTLVLLVGLGRAIWLQTVDSQALRREAAKNYMRTETIDTWRGDILDRHGKAMAISVHRWAITADPQRVSDSAATARVLAPIVGQSEAEILRKLDPLNATEEDDPQLNPAIGFGRQLTSPWVNSLSTFFGLPRAHFDRRLDILERFFQLEQLRSEAVFPLIDRLAETAEATARALDANVDDLRFVPRRGRRFTYIAYGLDDSAVTKLDEARDEEARRCREAREAGQRCKRALNAVFTRPESRRYYPKRELASQVVGLVGRDDHGLSGIENAMNAFLSGGMHRAVAVKDVRGQRIFLEGLPQDVTLEGNSIELSLDQQIQAWTEQELGRACLASGARAGYAIVTRPKTGEVLAIANFPNYNPNTSQEWFRDQAPLREERSALAQRRSDLAWASQFRLTNRAYGSQADATQREIQYGLDQEIDAFVEYQHTYPNASRNIAFLDVYEPGSIMKVFTAAAALEEKVVDLDTEFDLHNGHWRLDDVEGNIIHDLTRLERGNLNLILKKSSNIGATKLAFLMGAHKLDEYLRKFGFGAPTKSGFPGEPRGILRPPEQWVPIELANVSFGQGMATTGIQLAMALGALANEGILMQPLLVKRVLDAEGNTVRRWEPTKVREVVSPETARTVLDLMTSVVEPDGTGRRAYIPEWPVAGKTGTGQKPHLRRRGYSEDMWVNTFFGVAPVNDPELAIVILIDEPKGKRHGGGLIAAPAFRRIMERSLNHLGVASPYLSHMRQAWLEPDTLAKRRELENTPPETDPLAAAQPRVVAADGLVPAPNFTGLTMRAAASLAAASGLVVRFEGQGLAYTQSVQPDSPVNASEGLIVYFRSQLPLGNTRSDVRTPSAFEHATLDEESGIQSLPAHSEPPEGLATPDASGVAP